MRNWSIDQIVQVVEILINQSEGLGLDPETDFSSMRSTDNLNEVDPKLYAKTWKLISVQRERRVLKLVLFLDINCNVKERRKGEKLKAKSNTMKSQWFLRVMDQIINEFWWEVLIEIRSGDNEDITQDRETEIEQYENKDYESKLEDILEFAEKEEQIWNVVIIVSDFLQSVASSQRPVANALVCIQIQLPIFLQIIIHFIWKVLKGQKLSTGFRSKFWLFLPFQV